MPDETDKNFDDNTRPDNTAVDPLGIIGWDIAGKYKITKHLGGGGFGEVYDGYNINLPEQRLVLKFFKRVQARDKFAKEAKILCRLDHPNICRVIDFLAEEGALVVAFIDGHDGSQALKKSGALDGNILLKVAQTMTDALAYAHERQIAHRDIKPANIMIDNNDRIYLIDFGIAKEIGGDATRTGYQALTPMFAAPERQQGDVDYNPFLSDIYEMGVTLFTFATNTMPYRNPVNPDTTEWGGAAAEKMSPEMIQILKRATHPDPSKRFKNMREMADTIAELTHVYAIKRRRKTPIVLTVLFLLAAAAAVGEWQGYFDRWLGPRAGHSIAADSAIATDTDPPAAAEKSRAITVVPVETVTDTGTVASENQPVREIKKDPRTTAQTKPKKQPVSSKQEPAVEKEKAPPPPPKPRVSIHTRPASVINLYFDGLEQMPNHYFETTMGSHLAEIMDPDFPILSKNIQVTGKTSDHTLDLISEFSNVDSIEISLALNPPSDNHMLEVSLNSRILRFNSFPVFGLKRLSGEWQFEATIHPLNSDVRTRISIDSCVTSPFTEGNRFAIKGNEGRIRLEADEGNSTSTIPLVIYWSEK